MITQKTDETKRELSAMESEAAKKAFVEPEISSPINVLEATAFFQPTTGGTDTLPTDIG